MSQKLLAINSNSMISSEICLIINEHNIKLQTWIQIVTNGKNNNPTNEKKCTCLKSSNN